MAPRTLVIWGLVWCGLSLSVGTAYAETPPLELGVWAPRLIFESNVTRQTWVSRVAQALGRATGRSVHGRAFTRAADLMAFREAGRLDLVLADPVALATQKGRPRLLASGTGPAGTMPAMAALSFKGGRGLNAHEGRRLALVEGPLEVALASNFVLEGELDAGRFFSSVQQAPDMGEVLGWLESGRADLTLGYAQDGPAYGLKVVARLRGLPLPVLWATSTRIDPAFEATLRDGLAGAGLAIPRAGPLTHLGPPHTGDISGLRRALVSPPGIRPVRRAVWSPAPLLPLPKGTVMVRPNGRYTLPKPTGRWRVPDYPEL